MPTTPREPTLLELLEELAAWVTVPAPPEPTSAASYAARLRAAAARLAEEMAAHAHKQSWSGGRCDCGACRALERINGGPINSGDGTPGDDRG